MSTEKLVSIEQLMEKEVEQIVEVEKENVLKYVEELIGDGTIAFCSDEELIEIREKFEQLVKDI